MGERQRGIGEPDSTKCEFSTNAACRLAKIKVAPKSKCIPSTGQEDRFRSSCRASSSFRHRKERWSAQSCSPELGRRTHVLRGPGHDTWESRHSSCEEPPRRSAD